MNLRLFLAELRRRNVYKATVAYALFAWLVIQLATQVFPFFEIPSWTIRLMILLLVFATPFVTFFASVFELTPEGLKRTAEVDRRQSHWTEATRKLQRALQLDPRNFGIVQQLALAYEVQHRYADQARMCQLALAIVPNDPYTLMTRARIPFAEGADIKPFQTMLASLIAKDPKLAPDVDDPDHALCERTPEAAARALRNYPPDGVGINGVNYPPSYCEGVVARCQGDTAKARAAFAATRLEVEKIVQQQPDFAAALSFL